VKLLFFFSFFFFQLNPLFFILFSLFFLLFQFYFFKNKTISSLPSFFLILTMDISKPIGSKIIFLSGREREREGKALPTNAFSGAVLD
jgi:hypothetical protein